MQIRSQKGVTLVLLAIIIIVLGILAMVTTQEIGALMNNVKLENMSTNLLLIQAKSKVIYEKSNFNNDESMLKGQQVSEIIGNTKLDELKTNEVISELETDYTSYYLWDKQTIQELDIGIKDMKDSDFFVVNYKTEEVIYSEGYKHTNGNTYYKLSQILNLE